MRELSDSLKDGAQDVRQASARSPAAPGTQLPGSQLPDTPPPRLENLPRLLRPDEEIAEGRPDGFDAWRADVSADTIPEAGSLTLRGDDLPEPLIVVRVNATHWSGASGECPADGSELVWDAPADRLRCPACHSMWRLDGEPSAGPANAQLDVLFVEREPNGLRLTRP